MILNYDQIHEQVLGSVYDLDIEPFVDAQVEDGVISYGLGSFGYDIRIGNTFEVFTDVSSSPVDPKNFDDNSFVGKKVDDYIQIPPNSFVLGHAVERITMPKDLMGICLGKSTYARCGIIVNMTPVEPGWEGHLTIEISNTTPLPAKVYANEGIAQILFFEGDEPELTYADKSGKYQGQEEKIYHADVA
ncbi:dCTP deaminase [Candidatus Bipolaricaulota bacterium]|nr:dCTP deaminase [Candidatus Bipolaricaulota bacterium]